MTQNSVLKTYFSANVPSSIPVKYDTFWIPALEFASIIELKKYQDLLKEYVRTNLDQSTNMTECLISKCEVIWYSVQVSEPTEDYVFHRDFFDKRQWCENLGLTFTKSYTRTGRRKSKSSPVEGYWHFLDQRYLELFILRWA